MKETQDAKRKDEDRPSRVALAKNFKELTKEVGGIGAVAALLHIGAGSVTRIRDHGVVQTDTLEKIADYYSDSVKYVHELLMPDLGRSASPFRDLSPEEAGLIALFRAIQDPQKRDALMTKANSLAADGDEHKTAANPFGGKRAPRIAEFDSEPTPFDDTPRPVGRRRP